MHEIIFYNGFNLLVDIIIASISGYFFYVTGKHVGWKERGDHDAFIAEGYADHAYEVWRESQHG